MRKTVFWIIEIVFCLINYPIMAVYYDYIFNDDRFVNYRFTEWIELSDFIARYISQYYIPFLICLILFIIDVVYAFIKERRTYIAWIIDIILIFAVYIICKGSVQYVLHVFL